MRFARKLFSFLLGVVSIQVLLCGNLISGEPATMPRAPFNFGDMIAGDAGLRVMERTHLSEAGIDQHELERLIHELVEKYEEIAPLRGFLAEVGHKHPGAALELMLIDFEERNVTWAEVSHERREVFRYLVGAVDRRAEFFSDQLMGLDELFQSALGHVTSTDPDVIATSEIGEAWRALEWLRTQVHIGQIQVSLGQTVLEVGDDFRLGDWLGGTLEVAEARSALFERNARLFDTPIEIAEFNRDQRRLLEGYRSLIGEDEFLGAMKRRFIDYEEIRKAVSRIAEILARAVL